MISVRRHLTRTLIGTALALGGLGAGVMFFAARDAAVQAVKTGAQECLIRLAYAPNVTEPLDIAYEMTGRGHRMPSSFFEHGSMRQRYRTCLRPIHGLCGEGLDSWRPE